MSTERARILTGLGLIALVCVGCGDDDVAPSVDAGSRDGAAPDAARDPEVLPSGARVLAPDAPALPRFGTCPTGWRTIDAEGIQVCEPWPEGGRLPCSLGQAHFPGETTCLPIGAACGSGPWPSTLPTGTAALYVQAGASGGDGTRARPFGTVGAAVAVAPAGAVIAIAAGSYDEPIVLTSDVTLVGACVQRVTLGQTVMPLAATVAVNGGHAALRDLTITGAHFGVRVAGASADLQGVWLENTGESAVYVTGAGHVVMRSVVAKATRNFEMSGAALQVFGGSTADLSRVSFDDLSQAAVLVSDAASTATITSAQISRVAPESAGGRNGVGVVAASGATVTLRDSVIEATHEAALGALMGSTMTADAVVVSDVAAVPGHSGRGAVAERGSRLVVSRSRFEQIDGHALGFGGTGTTAQVTDCLVRDIAEPAFSATGTAGISVSTGADAVVERLLVERTSFAGVLATFGGTAHLTDVTVRDPVPSRSSLGYGVFSVSGNLELSRVEIHDATAAGIVSMHEAHMSGSSLRVVGTHPGPGQTGVGIYTGGVVALDRVEIDDTTGWGLIAPGGQYCMGTMCTPFPPPDAAITNLRVRHTTTAVAEDGSGVGRAIGAWLGSLRVTHAIVEDTHETGVYVSGPDTSLALEDAAIQRVESSDLDRTRGHGLVVLLGAHVTLSGVRLDSARELGVMVENDGSRLDATGLEILGTRETDCDMPAGACGGGIGLSARTGTTVQVTDFAIDGNFLAGVQVLEGASVDLMRGVVSRSLIGANVQASGYDIGRLTNDVRYVDNERNLDSAGLPLPPPGALPDLGF